MITNKEFRRVMIAFALFSLGMFVLGLWAGDKNCRDSAPQGNYCSAPRVERVEVPVGDREVLERFVECRRDLIELSEAFNSDINCHDRICK